MTDFEGALSGVALGLGLAAAVFFGLSLRDKRRERAESQAMLVARLRRRKGIIRKVGGVRIDYERGQVLFKDWEFLACGDPERSYCPVEGIWLTYGYANDELLEISKRPREFEQ